MTIAKAQEKHRQAVHEKFCERHPEIARHERALRKANIAARRDYGHKRNGTPETHQKAAAVKQGALARLFQAGSISVDQLAWAAEIRRVHERITSDVRVGCMSLESRVDTNRHFDGTFFEKLGLVRAELAYTAWRRALTHPGAVLAMVVDDEACLSVARRHAMGTRKARQLLVAALDDWPRRNKDARDAVDEADLLAAQAGLL